jgi:hypothetical protein
MLVVVSVFIGLEGRYDLLLDGEGLQRALRKMEV